MKTLEKQLTDNFFRYAAVTSQSDAANPALPSTEGQRELGKLLVQELQALGLVDVHMDEHAIVTARRPGSVASAPAIGFCAHLDTVDVAISPVVHPQVLHFTGQDLCLNKEKDIWFRVDEHPESAPYKGQDIIFSDGTSVLGADNKAAIAVIMALVANLQADTPPVGDVHVAFVPDEEIGLKGANKMDLQRFPVQFAYTIDCCALGEVVYETFNAAFATIEITGITAHPMSAKNVLVNPLRVAHDFMGYFDRRDTPEHTEGREGYFWFTDMAANPNKATLQMAIRDFDKASFEERKKYIQQAATLVQARHPRAKVTCTVTDVYSNIANSVGKEGHRSIDLIFEAMKELEITPNVIAMRGGTDGSALSARGLVTPNYFTGAHNFHSPFEFLPVPSFVRSYELTRRICELNAGERSVFR